MTLPTLAGGWPHTATIQALRDLADILERHPEMPWPTTSAKITGSLLSTDLGTSLARLHTAAQILGAPVLADEQHGCRRYWVETSGVLPLRLSVVTCRRPAAGDVVAAILTPDSPELPADPEVTHA